MCWRDLNFAPHEYTTNSQQLASGFLAKHWQLVNKINNANKYGQIKYWTS